MQMQAHCGPVRGRHGSHLGRIDDFLHRGIECQTHVPFKRGHHG